MKDFVKIEDVKDFNPIHVFECGQCFRWNKEDDGSYTGVAHNRVINVGKDKDSLIIKNANEEDFKGIWRNYFDLDRDYGYIKRILSEKDEIMKKAIDFGEGIRLLNQDQWEVIVSFIISQNRNIPTIKKNIEEISQKYGKYIESYNGKEYFSFPSPERLAEVSVEDLSTCRVGYRAEYIISTAKSVMQSKDFFDTAKLTDEELEKSLLNLHGIGPKVANCIMLFGMNRYKRFPIDVWIERIMDELYGLKGHEQVKNYAGEKFMLYGGFAQQYLFYYAREKKIGKK